MSFILSVIWIASVVVIIIKWRALSKAKKQSLQENPQDKKILKIAIIALAVSTILIGVLPKSSSNRTTNETASESTAVPEQTEESTPEATQETNPTSFEYNGFSIGFDHAAIETMEYSSDQYEVVYFNFANNSDSAAEFDLKFDVKMFQNGVELEKNYFFVNDTDKARSAEVQPGYSTMVAASYVIADTSTQITVQVEPLISFSDEVLLTLNINPSDGSLIQ